MATPVAINVFRLNFQKLLISPRVLHICQRPVMKCYGTIVSCRIPSDSIQTVSLDERNNSTLATQFKKATEDATISKRPLFCTSETDPANHSSRHEGFYYTVQPEHFTRWMRLGLRQHVYKTVKAFNESSIMVRKPATEIMQYMKMANYSAPIMRYVLYGQDGCGKSTTLSHIMHFCGTQGWIIAHVPWAAAYNRYHREIQPSTFCPGRFDLPVDDAEWLTNFRKTNEPLLKSLDLKVVNQYTWSKREVSDAGTPLLDVIDFGLARTKYASDVMGAVLKELRCAANNGLTKVLVAVDGANAFWAMTTIKQEEDRTKRHFGGVLTPVQHWKRMFQSDWCGGAAIFTVDGYATYPPDVKRYMPIDLLGKDGLELMDPFLPVSVENFSDKEAYSCIEYFIDRKWIQNEWAQTDDGQKELMGLSGANPLQLYLSTIHW